MRYERPEINLTSPLPSLQHSQTRVLPEVSLQTVPGEGAAGSADDQDPE